MGAEFTGPMRNQDKLPTSAPAVQYGVNGKVKQSDNTKGVKAGTGYIDRVAQSTVKRKGQSSKAWSYSE